MKPYKNQPKFAQEGLHGVIDDLLFQPDLDKKNTAELTALPMAKVPSSILKALKPHHTDYIRVDPIEARYWHIGVHPHDDRQVFYFVGNKAERVKKLNYGNIKQIYAFIKKSALTTQIEADTLSGGKKAFSGGGSHGQSAAGLGTSTKKNSYFKNEGAGLDSGRGPSASQSSKRKNYPGNKKTIGKPNNSMQPIDTVAPSVIINQPKPKQVIKLEQNQATKRRFAYHQLGPGETAASVVERYTGTPNENRIYGFNYPQFTAKNPPQAGDEVRVSTGFDVLVKGQFYNSNKVFVMWNGPTTGSKTATLEQVNGEYQQDRGYDWELVLPLVGGEYTITAEAGGVTDSVSFTVDASVERMMSANNRNQQIDTNAQFAAEEARWASRQQGVVDSANGLSTSMDSARLHLTQRHNAQISSAHSAIAKSARFTSNDNFEVNYGFESELVTGNQNGWVNNALIENTLNQYAKDNFNVLPTNSALSTWDYNSRYAMEQLPSLFGTNEINGALLGLGALAKTTSKGWGSTGSNYKSMQNGVVGSYFDRVYGVGRATVINNYALDTRLFTSGIANVGDNLTKLGFGFTAASGVITLANDQLYGDGVDFGDGFREAGYLAVNGVFAASSFNLFKDISALTRLSPVGMAFTGLDIVLQATPSYTVKYGPHAGQVTNGWTKAMHQTSDIVHANQQINPNYRMFDIGKL